MFMMISVYSVANLFIPVKPFTNNEIFKSKMLVFKEKNLVIQHIEVT